MRGQWSRFRQSFRAERPGAKVASIRGVDMRAQVAEEWVRRLAWLATVAIAGCMGGGHAGPAKGALSGDAGTGGVCARPAPGCACEAGSAPVTCYADAQPVSAGFYCQQGLMYCRDGAWSSCQTVRSYTLHTANALIAGPSTCNPCNPDCFGTVDQPDQTDLTPNNSDNVVYDPNQGGITIIDQLGGQPPMLQDSDNDGVPDVADDCPNDPTRWYDPTGQCTGTVTTGYFHVLPFNGPAQYDPLNFNVQVTTADIYFLLDDSGSMDGEQMDLQKYLTSTSLVPGCNGGVIGAIQCIIPNAWIGVGSFNEYPVWPYGLQGNYPYKHWQDLSASAAGAQAAVNQLTTHGNYDEPEADVHALWAMATGNGLPGIGPTYYVPARTGCPAGTWGYGCFRTGTIPIVILVTDAPFHNGPGNAYPYYASDFGNAPTLPAPTSYTSVSGNDTVVSAYDMGDLTGRSLGFTGDTRTLNDDYANWCGGMNNPSVGSGPGDAVFKFTLSQPAEVTASLNGSTTMSTTQTVCYWGRCYRQTVTTYPYVGIFASNGTPEGCGRSVDTTLQAGTYYVLVDGESDWANQYQLQIGALPQSNLIEPPTWQDMVDALNAKGFKVIVLESHDPNKLSQADTPAHADALCNATGSVDGNGNPYVFHFNPDGTGLSSTIVTAVQTLANNTRFDVAAIAQDNPATTNVDESNFVKAITPVSWGPGDCQGTTVNGFTQCTPGTILNFDVQFQNDFVMPTNVDQVFTFDIQVLLNGSVQQTIPARIVVPALVPQYPNPGYYSRDYDASQTCTIPPQGPDWGTLQYQVSTPSNTSGTTSVRFEVRTAATQAGLDSATAATFTVPADGADAGSFDVAQLLLDAGLPVNLPYLRVTAVLNPSPDHVIAPTLSGFTFQYNCVAGS